MHKLKRDNRFVDCEAWRKDFNLDELVRSFDYTEKAEVFQYYPQYYHKTDKVADTRLIFVQFGVLTHVN